MQLVYDALDCPFTPAVLPVNAQALSSTDANADSLTPTSRFCRWLLTVPLPRPAPGLPAHRP